MSSTAVALVAARDEEQMYEQAIELTTVVQGFAEGGAPKKRANSSEESPSLLKKICY
jgi:hypothetical protein